MDYVRLVEEGVYKKNELTEVQKAYISGLDCAIDCLDGLVDDSDVEDEWSSTLQNIKKEIVNSTIASVKDCLYIAKCGHIVGFGDANAREGDD